MLTVQRISRFQVNVGGSVVVFGSGFDSLCWVLVGDRYANIVDYDGDSLEFSAPPEIGRYAVSVGRGQETFKNFTLEVCSLRNVESWNLPVRTKDDFRDAFLGLMPRGFAWFVGRGGNWCELFTGFASGLFVLYSLYRQLVYAIDPTKTTCYADWENELNLPIKGVERDSDDGRLDEIYRIARKRGGNTVPYFKSLAALFGLDVRIYEYWKNPEKFDDVNFGDKDPNFFWMVEIDSDNADWHVCTCNDTCNDYLQWWWNAPLESLIDFVKPAHTQVLYRYVVAN